MAGQGHPGPQLVSLEGNSAVPGGPVVGAQTQAPGHLRPVLKSRPRLVSSRHRTPWYPEANPCRRRRCGYFLVTRRHPTSCSARVRRPILVTSGSDWAVRISTFLGSTPLALSRFARVARPEAFATCLPSQNPRYSLFRTSSLNLLSLQEQRLEPQCLPRHLEIQVLFSFREHGSRPSHLRDSKRIAIRKRNRPLTL
jgi:hypothetical protein